MSAPNQIDKATNLWVLLAVSRALTVVVAVVAAAAFLAFRNWWILAAFAAVEALLIGAMLYVRNYFMYRK